MPELDITCAQFILCAYIYLQEFMRRLCQIFRYPPIECYILKHIVLLMLTVQYAMAQNTCFAQCLFHK
jgi:hypothetical protein